MSCIGCVITFFTRLWPDMVELKFVLFLLFYDVYINDVSKPVCVSFALFFFFLLSDVLLRMMMMPRRFLFFLCG